MNRNSKHFQPLRRLTALLLAAAFVWAAALPAFAEGTEAAQSDTIYISSTADLLSLVQNCAVDSWSKGKTVILQEDLSLEGVEWEPIPSFSGTFLGNSHEIRDLELEKSYSPAGMFAIVEEGAVISSLSVQGWVAPGGEKGTVGGIAGVNKGTITNCQFSGAVDGGTDVGGIVGLNDETGVLDRCTSRSIVTGKSSTGGVAGRNAGAITSCTNVGAVNAAYQDTTLNLDGLSADVLSYIEQKIDSSAEPLSSNAPTDTGGIAGRSSGMILSSNNVGTVGYEHLGYNVGGIVGRSDGFVSGCINQGEIYGRKDVGGIVGQAEPYSELDLSQSTLEKLRTELDKLHDVVDGSADEMDNSSAIINNDLNALQAQMNTAIDAARQLQEQGSDYFDTVADEIDRTGVLLSDTLGRMEPMLDTTEQAMEKMTDALDDLRWAVSEASMEIGYLSDDLDYIRSAASQTGDAMDYTQQGLEMIGKGMQQLRDSYNRGDESGAQAAISQALSGYSMLSESNVDEHLRSAMQLLKVANSLFSAFSVSSSMSVEMKAITAGLGLLRTAAVVSGVDTSQYSSAARQVTKGLRQLSRLSSQMGTLMGNASSAASARGSSQMASALSGISRAFDTVSGGLSDLDDLLTDIGFDTGELKTGAETIEAGIGRLEDAAAQLRDATDDLETGIAWLERDGSLVSSTVQRFSDAIDTLKDASSGITDAMGQLRDTVRWLNDQDPISMPRPDSAMQDTTDTLFDAMDAMTNQMGTLNQNLKGASDRLTNQVRAINDQIQVVTGLLLDAVQEISEPGSKTILEDESEGDPTRTDGRIESCINRGTVQADVDVGGIAGAIAVENLLDPEDDNLNESGSLLRTGYSVSAVVDGCVNDGNVESKKTAAGGIVGRMDLGLVQNCEAYGDVEGANQVGGIAGASSAKLLANWAKCRLSGTNYVGGILGEGTESRLTKGSSIVNDCRALVDILEADQFAGAISGGQTGDFSGNLFVSDSLRGIDRLSKVGQAEPTTYEELIAQENAPERFKQITVTFKDEDHVLGRVQLAYGGSLDASGYPELPAKEGCAARWDTTELNNVRVDTVVEAVYTDYITALASPNERDDGRAVFFAKGQFGDRDSLTVSMQDAPAQLHNVVESWRVTIPDDGLESHDLRYLPPDDGQKYKVYVLQDGSWKQLTTETIGSYLSFTVSGSEVELAIVHAAGVPVWAFVAAGAAVLVLLGTVLIKKKRRKKAKAAQAEAENKSETENQTENT